MPLYRLCHVSCSITCPRVLVRALTYLGVTDQLAWRLVSLTMGLRSGVVQDVLDMESPGRRICSGGVVSRRHCTESATVATHNAPVHFPIKVLRSLPYKGRRPQRLVSAKRRSIGGAKATCKGIRANTACGHTLIFKFWHCKCSAASETAGILFSFFPCQNAAEFCCTSGQAHLPIIHGCAWRLARPGQSGGVMGFSCEQGPAMRDQGSPWNLSVPP